MSLVDFAIHESGDGGDLSLKADDLDTIQGLTNQVYLALFGGNVDAVTTTQSAELEQRTDYWANEFLFENTENQFNSTFEKMLNETPLTSAGVVALENAATDDLKFLKEYADIEIYGRVSGVNKFELTVGLTEPSQQSIKIKFLWDGTNKTIVTQEII